MKLTKRLATISTAVTAAILISAGGAQAQSAGGSIPILDSIPLLRVLQPTGLAGLRDAATGTQSTNNDNNNNNATGGPNNNNNNNSGRTNNNNNNNNGDTPTQGDGGIFPLLGKSLFNFQVCYPTGQHGAVNKFRGNQNINCHQS
ncbi:MULTISPECIES: hypothetical protein [unclassified Streptomyces]|uniref:hypothetical protein n=1 Tax=unclassified Streptomyces TaxID=2593676 RepID=UPI0034153380